MLGIAAIAGLVFTAAFMLRVLGRAMFGPKNPKWEHIRTLEIGYDYSSAGVITVVFLNEDDLIVQCELDAVAICGGGNKREWYDCLFEGEVQGKCEIKTVYHGP